MCWADKASIFVLSLVVVFALIIVHPATPDGEYPGAIGLLRPDCLEAFAGVFFVIWVPLRLFDWVIGGPARRKAAQGHSRATLV